MTATAVTYSNLTSESRNNVVTLLSSTSNVVDPIVTSGEFRKWIYSRAPDTKAADFKGFPFIVVNPANYDPEVGGSMNGKSKFVSWEIEIEIFTSDRGYGGHDGQGLTHMDAITDDVVQTLSAMTNRNTLSGNNLKFSRPRLTSVTTEAIEDTLVYRRSIMATFKNRIHVSA